MRERPYDPSWRALLFPSLADDFFAHGRPRDERALCAELSRLAYLGFDRTAGEQQRATDILANAGFGAVTYLSRGGTDCFVARDANAALTVVAFRGTSSGQDMLTDLMAWRIRWHPGGRAHAGFAWALRRVWPALLQVLTHHSGRLLYTGHSLGGALATLAATLLPPGALYTFGSPRVGNARFATLLRDVDHVRTTDCADVVCDVPPAWLGYAHSGSQSYVDRHGIVREGLDRPRQREDRRIARREYLRRLAWRPGNVWTRRLADHAPVNYASVSQDEA
jgi:hypothetical protein